MLASGARKWVLGTVLGLFDAPKLILGWLLGLGSPSDGDFGPTAALYQRPEWEKFLLPVDPALALW